jgi:hypothetical protein
MTASSQSRIISGIRSFRIALRGKPDPERSNTSFRNTQLHRNLPDFLSVEEINHCYIIQAIDLSKLLKARGTGDSGNHVQLWVAGL